jgi:glutamate synthase domain-containing protein 1
MARSEIDSIRTEVEKLSTKGEKLRSTLDESIAAYALRHGGSSDNVDLDPALEAASLELWIDEDNVR